MASFSSCSFQRKNKPSCNIKCKPEKKNHCAVFEDCNEDKCSKSRSEKDRSNSANSARKQRSRSANSQHNKERESSIEKRSNKFNNELAKNKAKEFRDSKSKSKAESNKFQRADKAKKLRRNHVDNQRDKKSSDYCMIEEKKFIRKRFVKDQESAEMEDLDRQFCADFETAKEERAQSCSQNKCSDEKECSFVENARSCASEKGDKRSCENSQNACSESESESSCSYSSKSHSESECEESNKSPKKCNRSRKC